MVWPLVGLSLITLLFVLRERLPPDAQPTKSKIVARNMATQAAQVQAKAYVPIFALMPLALKALRAWTNSALHAISMLKKD